MRGELILQLGQNLTLALALVYVTSLLLPVLRRLPGAARQATLGLLFGGAALIAMQTPIRLTGDVIIDSRTVLVALAGYLLGWPGALAAATPAVVYRIVIGGPAALAGVSIIIMVAATGAAFHAWDPTRGGKSSLRRLTVFGLLVSIEAVTLALLLPWETALWFYQQMAAPVAATFTLGIVVIGWLFHREYSRREDERILLLMRHSLNASQDAAFWMHPEDGRIVYVNDAACRSLGYAREQLLTMSLWDVDHHLTRERWSKRVRELRNGVKLTLETTQRRADGSELPVEVKVSLVEFDEKEYVCGLARDLTERRRAEEARAQLENELQHAQKMEAIGRLAGGVAHDFNNMLSVILGNAELALDEKTVSAPVRAELEEIREAATRSAALTRQLLAFARRQAATPEVLDLNTTIDEMFRMLQRLIGAEVELSWQPGEGLWPVRIDPVQIDQILVNLCVNARDAIDGEGRITIETHNIDACASCPRHREVEGGDYVRLRVRDTGCGMDAETAANIFEPFYTTKSEGKGTGLGLATVYGIVRQNGGMIHVDSEPGRGSTFCICLPRHRGESTATDSSDSAASEGRAGETVLLVEDEASMLKLCRLMLEGLGYHVVTASTPDEAVTLINEGLADVDLLLTDVMMPGMNGFELAARLREARPGMRSLFMSAYTTNAIADQGSLDETVHYIHKPFNRRDLALKLREVLNDAPSTQSAR